MLQKNNLHTRKPERIQQNTENSPDPAACSGHGVLRGCCSLLLALSSKDASTEDAKTSTPCFLDGCSIPSRALDSSLPPEMSSIQPRTPVRYDRGFKAMPEGIQYPIALSTDINCIYAKPRHSQRFAAPSSQRTRAFS